MASISQTTAVRVANGVTSRGGLVDKYFYFAMSLLATAIVVAGFSKTVNVKLFHPAVTPPMILWFHGAAFSAWVLFFVLQSALVRTRNVKLHRSLGWFGAGLGAVMVPLGLTTAIVMGRFDIHVLHVPGVEPFLVIPFFDMVAFGTFFTMAILLRRKKELHRRLIFITTCCILDAAFGRYEYLFVNALTFWCIDGVIALGAVRDLIVDRRVHSLYLIALPTLVVVQYCVNYTWLHASPWWVAIAHSLVG
jgi:hypothetical protein